MGGMFHGAAVITLDAKGRIAIPTRHRDALTAAGKTLVLTAHPDGCALVYPESEWHYFELWDAGVWNAKLAAALSGTGAPPPGMEGFSL